MMTDAVMPQPGRSKTGKGKKWMTALIVVLVTAAVLILLFLIFREYIREWIWQWLWPGDPGMIDSSLR